jgi:hypothetical protein
MVIERRNQLALDTAERTTGSPLQAGFVMCPVYGTTAMMGGIAAIYQWAYFQSLAQVSAAQPTRKWPPPLNMN